MYQYKATQIEIHAGDGAVPEAFGFNQSRYHDVAFLVQTHYRFLK